MERRRSFDDAKLKLFPKNKCSPLEIVTKPQNVSSENEIKHLLCEQFSSITRETIEKESEKSEVDETLASSN